MSLGTMTKEAIPALKRMQWGWSNMFVVTGNRLLDGIVVYLADKHNWVENLQDAQVYGIADEAKSALAEQSDVVVSLDVIPVAKDAQGALRADRLRERIRADGPTIQPFETINLERTF